MLPPERCPPTPNHLPPLDFTKCVVCQGQRLIICTDHIPKLRVVRAASKDDDNDSDSVDSDQRFALRPGEGRQPGKSHRTRLASRVTNMGWFDPIRWLIPV